MEIENYNQRNPKKKIHYIFRDQQELYNQIKKWYANAVCTENDIIR